MLSVTCAGRKDTLRRTVGIKQTKGLGKERKARKARKAREAKGKAQNPRMVTPRRKVARHNCGEVGHFARECQRKKESNNARSSGGGDAHCLTYTDDQSHWIMMLAEVGQSREQSNNIEFQWIQELHAMRGRAKQNLVLPEVGHF